MAAAANAQWDKAKGMGIVLTNESGDNSWPVTAASFILVHQQADNPTATKAVFDFFDWAFEKGKNAASELDYVPLPDEVVAKIKQKWQNEVKDKDGKAVR